MNDLKHYMSLPYRMEIIPDEGAFIVRIPDLPGCMSSGETVEEALDGIKDAKELWISARLDAGNSVPEPSSEDDKSYSGKFVIRIPKSLHRNLDEQARAEHMSLNSYVLFLLTQQHTRHINENVTPVNMFATPQVVCWGPEVYHRTGVVKEMVKEIVDIETTFGDLDQVIPHIDAVPRPPKSQFNFGTVNAEKKKEFSH